MRLRTVTVFDTVTDPARSDKVRPAWSSSRWNDWARPGLRLLESVDTFEQGVRTVLARQTVWFKQ